MPFCALFFIEFAELSEVLTDIMKLIYIKANIANYQLKETWAMAKKPPKTQVRKTGVRQPKTRVRAQQPTKVVRKTVIVKEAPEAAKGRGSTPWVVIAVVIVVLLLLFLPIFPAEKTVERTETIMVPVTKERQEQVTVDETIKTYQGYMVERGGNEPRTSTGTTTGPWSGTWWAGGEDYEEYLTTTQNGNQVSGSYTTNDPNDKGNIAGIVSGNQWTGMWSETPTYQPPDDAGDMELTLAPDGQSMTGRYRYGSSGSWIYFTYTRTGPGTGTGTGMRTGTGTRTITIDAVAEIVEVQRARGPDATWTLTLAAYDGTQTVYRSIVEDDLTKTGKSTVQVTKTVTKPYTEQVPQQVTKQETIDLRVNLLSLILKNY
jgi:hypothetical protein